MNLQDFEAYLKAKTDTHAGYPYNLRYDYSELAPFLRYSINNLGDPYVESNYLLHSRAYEKDVVAFFAELYGAGDYWGYVTTSNTEGNFYGVLLGREQYPEGVLYSSRDTHYSIAKAARFFKIPHVVVDSLPHGEIDYEDLRRKLDPGRPALVTVNLGTTLRGAMDDLDRVIDVLDRAGVRDHFIHCDGALGGMLVPYLRPGWVSFAKPIGSVAISGHKFIGCPFPCGIVVTRKEHADRMASNIEYIGSKDSTIGGSRKGHAPLFLIYAIATRKDHFGDEARDCVAKAMYLCERLQRSGVPALLNDVSTTVVFRKPQPEVARRWQFSTQGDLAYVVVMQNHTYAFLDALADELVQAASEGDRGV